MVNTSCEKSHSLSGPKKYELVEPALRYTIPAVSITQAHNGFNNIIFTERTKHINGVRKAWKI